MQSCISPKDEHEPEIKRFYDEERPDMVLKQFVCRKCAYLMDTQLIEKIDDDSETVQ